MTRQSEYESRIERLRVVVSAYGGDPSRWPAQDRDELLDLVDTNPEAMAIVRDGEQFDQLLDVANVADVRSEAETDFADRIFAAVTAEENIKPLLPQQETPADNVIDFASRRKTSSQDHAARMSKKEPWKYHRTNVPCIRIVEVSWRTNMPQHHCVSSHKTMPFAK